jgi:hypothetical protein
VFSGVFASVLDACFKCFIGLHMYVVNVASRCFLAFYCLASVSPRLLLSACLASFSDRGGGVTKVGGGAAPRDSGVNVSAYSPLLCYAGWNRIFVGLHFFRRIHWTQVSEQGCRFRRQPKPTYRVTVGWWEPHSDTPLRPDVRALVPPQLIRLVLV